MSNYPDDVTQASFDRYFDKLDEPEPEDLMKDEPIECPHGVPFWDPCAICDKGIANEND